MTSAFRQGTIVKPYQRLDADQIKHLHRASLAILKEPGIWCYNRRAAKLFADAGAGVREEKEHGQAGLAGAAGLSDFTVRRPCGRSRRQGPLQLFFRRP